MQKKQAIFLIIFMSLQLNSLYAAQWEAKEPQPGTFVGTDTISKADTIYIEEVIYEYDTVRVTKPKEKDSLPQELVRERERDSVITERDSIALQSHEEKPPLKIRFGLGADFEFHPYTDMGHQPGSKGGEYSQMLQENLKEQQMLEYGLQLGALYQNWGLNTGMRYSQYSEQYDYSTTSSWYDSSFVQTVDTLDSYYMIHGTDTVEHFITERDEYWQYDSGTTKTDYVDKLQYTCISLPLLLGYHYPLSPRLALNALGGVRIGFVILQKGHLPAYPGTATSPTLRDINLSWQLQIGANYLIYRSWGLSASANYHHHGQSLFRENEYVARKPWSLGLSLGIFNYF